MRFRAGLIKWFVAGQFVVIAFVCLGVALDGVLRGSPAETAAGAACAIVSSLLAYASFTWHGAIRRGPPGAEP